MAGKGSTRRKEDVKKVRANWDHIKGFGVSKINGRTIIDFTTGVEQKSSIIDGLFKDIPIMVPSGEAIRIAIIGTDMRPESQHTLLTMSLCNDFACALTKPGDKCEVCTDHKNHYNTTLFRIERDRAIVHISAMTTHDSYDMCGTSYLYTHEIVINVTPTTFGDNNDKADALKCEIVKCKDVAENKWQHILKLPLPKMPEWIKNSRSGHKQGAIPFFGGYRKKPYRGVISATGG